jgi:sucrose phosphorylase
MYEKWSQYLDRIAQIMGELYPGQHKQCMARFEMILGRYGVEPRPVSEAAGWCERDAFLITYGNTLSSEGESPLKTLHNFLHDKLDGAITGVHILPFFPYSSDDGFSVINYREVNPDLGRWEHVEAISQEFKLMADLVLNHVSRESKWFQEYILGLLPCVDYFIEVDPSEDLSQVVRPRSTSLLTEVHMRDGQRYLWTTFSDDQIDLDFSNPDVLFEFIDILLFYISKGVKVLRLDAIAYVWKKLGTECIHLPEAHKIVKLFRAIVDLVAPDVFIITETNVPHEENISYFGDGDEAHMVYQFSLPPLLLHALRKGTSRFLTEWAQALSDMPEGCTYFNFTASHDGIGIRPLEGLLPRKEIDDLVEGTRQRGGMVKTRKDEKGRDKPYELNCTYFDALKGIDGNDDMDVGRFICSQAIPLSMKGVPAVYIHSLLGTPNDIQGVRDSGEPRAINRARLKIDDVYADLVQPSNQRAEVFRRYNFLLRVRAKHPAFHPEAEQHIFDLGNELFVLERISCDGTERILAIHNLTDRLVEVKVEGENLRHWQKVKPWQDVIGGGRYGQDSSSIAMEPYEVLWLTGSP